MWNYLFYLCRKIGFLISWDETELLAFNAQHISAYQDQGRTSSLFQGLYHTTENTSWISQNSHNDLHFSWRRALSPVWMPECQLAIDSLKQQLTWASVFTNFDPSLPTQLCVNVSYVLLEAVLTQVLGLVSYMLNKVTDTCRHKHSPN